MPQHDFEMSSRRYAHPRYRFGAGCLTRRSSMITRLAPTIAIGLSGVAASSIQSHAVDPTPIAQLLK
jgi:hypothetical protein